MPLEVDRSRPLALAVIVIALLVALVSPAGADEDEERLEELKAEREQVQLELAARAIQVDAATANHEDLITALDDINALVDLQESRLAEAEQSVRSAEQHVRDAERRRAEIAAEIEGLNGVLVDLAVAAFTGESGANGEDLTAFLVAEDPTQAARRRSLVEFQTGSLSDTMDRMRRLESEAGIVEDQRIAAVGEAEAEQAEVERRRGELEVSQSAQIELVIAAEARLEARLAEAAFIEEMDAELAGQIRRQEEAIARRIREEAARKAAEEAARRRTNLPAPVDRDDLVNAEGFIVHVDVADAVGRMIRAAEGDGVRLTGWGWRSSQRTAELRVINGCPDVHESPPSSCRIPTARPGQSMHEFGRAIDFERCWYSSACFQWLSSNAAAYGFVNLPGESWHWSTNGR